MNVEGGSDSVGIVQDHLVQRGGAERVLLSMAKAFPAARIYTSFYWPEACFPEFADLDIKRMSIDRVPGLRRHHRAALPFLPFAFDHLRIKADVVVCASSGWAAGARTSGRKVIYFQSLARWLHEPETYLSGSGIVAKIGNRAVRKRLIAWDRAAVRSGDQHFACSNSMATRASELYDVAVKILPPPVVVRPEGATTPIAGISAGFVLCPCRLIAYKNVDVVIDAFRARTDDHLVVAGDGPEERRLRATAPPNVTFVGAVDDGAMRWLYRNCRSVVSAAIEPFGLVTLEANAFGKPVAALDDGGFRDTVVPGHTGFLFPAGGADAVCAGLDAVDAHVFRADDLRHHAAQWSEPAFIRRIRAAIDLPAVA